VNEPSTSRVRKLNLVEDQVPPVFHSHRVEIDAPGEASEATLGILRGGQSLIVQWGEAACVAFTLPISLVQQCRRAVSPLPGLRM
jgi:hypothetical protein